MEFLKINVTVLEDILLIFSHINDYFCIKGSSVILNAKYEQKFDRGLRNLQLFKLLHFFNLFFFNLVKFNKN